MPFLRVFCWFFLLIGCCASLGAQAPTMSTISTRWQDSFAAWEIYATQRVPDLEEGEEPSEELYGDLKLRWLNIRDDWSEWDFELGGNRGTIRQKWKDDLQQWELRTYSGVIVTMRTAWNGDFRQWRVSDNTISLMLKSKWTNQLDQWLVDDSNYGQFYLYTLRSQDPRDWAIEDKLAYEVSEEMKLAMIFLVVFNTTPRQ